MPTDLVTGGGSNPGAQSLQHRQQSLNNNASTANNASKNNASGQNNSAFSTSGYGNSNGHSHRHWATVSWMPHASLSQTSHVAISVRAALARIDDTYSDFGRRRRRSASKDSWRVSVSVHGLAGLSLVPVNSQTRSVPLLPLHSEDEGGADNYSALANHEFTEAQQQGAFGSKDACKHPSVHETTHVCRWDDDKSGRSMMQIPLRWRDLPRDAYLEFSLKGSRGEEALYETATLSFFDDYGKLRSGCPFFDDYGKLRSGLNKLPLFRKSSSKSKKSDANRGLASTSRIPSSQWQDCDDDPVWKASKILEQLDRFDQQNSTNSNSNSNTAGRPNERQLRQLPRKPVSREASPFRNHRGSNAGSNFGNIPSVPWLDKMAREYCEETLREAKESSKHLVVWPREENDEEAKEEEEKVPSAYLLIEIPSFDVPVVHEETFYPTPQQGPSGSVTPLDVALYQREQQQQKEKNSEISSSQQEQRELEPPSFHALSAVPFLDYENENDSPIDDKYRTLAHDLLRGLVDPALKPDRIQRDKLAAIIASPSHHPSREEKDLLWRFRFSLVDNRKALTKFLLAVDWTVETEVVQAAELLEQWRKRSPIEVTDALKLLGKQVAYQTNLVRAYAIDTLASAPDEELNLYLLQLVQALKFENSIQQQEQLGSAGASSDGGATAPKKKSSLATFLITRASKNVLLANYLYWYLKVELQDPAHGARYREIFDDYKAVLSRAPHPKFLSKTQAGNPPRHSSSSSSPMASSTSLVNKLGESVSKLVGDKLLGTDNDNSEQNTKTGKSSKKSKPKVRSVWDVLVDQDKFISGVMEVQLSYQSKPRQPAKEAHLRSVLAKEGYEPPSSAAAKDGSSPLSRLPFPMPCAPEIQVDGVFPEKAKVFKSAVYPALIEFRVDHVVDKALFGSHISHNDKGRGHRASPRSKSSKQYGRPPESPTMGVSATIGAVPKLSSYRVLMKTGDDLRQDQLVMMMIKLMDRLLKRASLDLCITPYSIIATSPSSGMIEFVEESSPLSAILANHNNSILQFFQSVAPQTGSKYGIRPDVLSSYVRSVAGGCVLTYLMGVGDRHLDNLMITKTGRFFHIDFGFLFGRDPKPLPPAFRLTREMVEGMGGSESAEYRQFCSLACQAFNALRKSAGLVLNLLHLMSDAGIEDLSNNPSADADGVIAKVEERFRLDLTDEQAERYFLTLINDSLTALAPRLMDVFHTIAVSRR
eukprot:CAMPEP_0116108996 /NCGR_PEP_ID=MMETSP0327-20121206/17089_1 /TAXON_ID=44447 /ORGANISM="Pseudo-nitzschia delicatissima, Strain B596" /LENGTH=1216 /DNA_ID=CAMNT_0003601957 /DNA_START=270 /DNA_END=3920 /DNA_ORIENTATION=-